ncbi:MAG: hypothetical protein L0229_23615 [Blastocatellia bacterium]|nr:hypothetical protein [Blastocatellia bacterium]
MKIDRKASFIHAVYPFLFDAFEPGSFEKRVRAIESARWPVEDRKINVWQMALFPEAELLPHVARYLNPPDTTAATARLWKLNDRLQDIYGLDGKAGWRLRSPRGEVPFRFGETGEDYFAAQLALFHIGVGFLTARIRPETDELDDWLDFLHHFRFAWGERGASVQAERQIDDGASVPFFPEPAGGINEHADGSGYFGELLDAMLRTGALDGETAPWWRDVFVRGRLLPFTALYVDALPEEQIPIVVYRVHNCFHARQEIHPASEDISLDRPALMPYAENQWFVFTLESGAFVAFDAPDTRFYRAVLPRHLRDQYFILFLLALHQRFALMKLSDEVAMNWLAGNEGDSESPLEMKREESFRRIRDALLAFTARGHFTQVMQRKNHHRCYLKWQETFQVKQLYGEVSDEVREMHNYLLMRRTERLQQLAEEQQRQSNAEAEASRARAQYLERLISYLALLLGVPALLLSYLGINLRGFTSEEGLKWWMPALAGLGGVLFGGIIVWMVSLLARRSHKGRR